MIVYMVEFGTGIPANSKFGGKIFLGVEEECGRVKYLRKDGLELTEEGDGHPDFYFPSKLEAATVLFEHYPESILKEITHREYIDLCRGGEDQ